MEPYLHYPTLLDWVEHLFAFAGVYLLGRNRTWENMWNRLRKPTSLDT